MGAEVGTFGIERNSSKIEHIANAKAFDEIELDSKISEIKGYIKKILEIDIKTCKDTIENSAIDLFEIYFKELKEYGKTEKELKSIGIDNFLFEKIKKIKEKIIINGIKEDISIINSNINDDLFLDLTLSTFNYKYKKLKEMGKSDKFFKELGITKEFLKKIQTIQDKKVKNLESDFIKIEGTEKNDKKTQIEILKKDLNRVINDVENLDVIDATLSEFEKIVKNLEKLGINKRKMNIPNNSYELYRYKILSVIDFKNFYSTFYSNGKIEDLKHYDLSTIIKIINNFKASIENLKALGLENGKININETIIKNMTSLLEYFNTKNEKKEELLEYFKKICIDC